jgi:release factor glutamine methyltransferase
MLLKEVRNIFHHELDSLYPPGEVDSFFYWFVEHYLGLERFVLALQPGLVISKESEDLFFKGLARLALEHPIQYITGEANFMGLTLKVNDQVLIPRPETEELTQWILSDVEKNSIRAQRTHLPLQILDIGTGSGCIAIALAKNLPGSQVHGLDLSEEVLDVARQNAILNDVSVSWIQADILLMEHLQPELDIVVSNPPYIRYSEMAHISRNVKEFEPNRSLFVPDEDPLLFYRHIADLASRDLPVNGLLYFEINQYLGSETCKLLEDRNFSEIELRKDIYGNERMIRAVQNKLSG